MKKKIFIAVGFAVFILCLILLTVPIYGLNASPTLVFGSSNGTEYNGFYAGYSDNCTRLQITDNCTKK